MNIPHSQSPMPLYSVINWGSDQSTKMTYSNFKKSLYALLSFPTNSSSDEDDCFLGRAYHDE